MFKANSIHSPHSGAATAGGVSVSTKELIDLRLLANKISLPPKRRIATNLAGGYLSTLRGRGIEFEEVRGYQPGDDIRAMDWRVTARTGKPHTKLFRAEREKPVYIIVDGSPSMYFGTRVTFKSCVAARAAALLAWSAASNRDRVGGLLFAPGQHAEFRPSASHRGISQMLKSIADLTQQLPAQFIVNPMGDAISRLRRLAKPGSTIFIISDFASLDAQAEQHILQLSQHHEIFAVLVSDPIENTPPPAGRYTVSDGTHFAVLDTASRSAQERYSANNQARYRTLESLSQRARMLLLRLSTTDDVAAALVHQLGART